MRRQDHFGPLLGQQRRTMDPPVGISRQYFAHRRCRGGLQEIDTQVRGANSVRLCLFVVLALIVAIDRPRETEADDKAEKGERSR